MEVATIDMSSPSLHPIVHFGKHRGKAWKDVPADYLRWIVDESNMDIDTKLTAKRHLVGKSDGRPANVVDRADPGDVTIKKSKNISASDLRRRICTLQHGELTTVHRNLYGIELPSNVDGRSAVKITLRLIAEMGGDVERRMDAFLDLEAPWMPEAECRTEKDDALASKKLYGADELAKVYGITYAMRTNMGLTVIGSIDVTADQREAIRKKWKNKKKAEKRKRKRLCPRSRETEPEKRAYAIGKLLPERRVVDVGNLCQEIELRKVKAFTGRGGKMLGGQSLKQAVLRAIDWGVDAGILGAQTLPGPTLAQTKRQVWRCR